MNTNENNDSCIDLINFDSLATKPDQFVRSCEIIYTNALNLKKSVTKCEKDGCVLHAPDNASANDGSCTHLVCGAKIKQLEYICGLVCKEEVGESI